MNWSLGLVIQMQKSGNPINFVDETKQLSPEEVRVQERKIDQRREIISEFHIKKPINSKQPQKKK